MQKTVTLVYSSDTFSRIMHNLSNNDVDDDEKQREREREYRGRKLGGWWEMCKFACLHDNKLNKSTPLVITLATFVSLFFHSMCLTSSHHSFCLFHAYARSMTTDEEIGHITTLDVSCSSLEIYVKLCRALIFFY